MVLHKKEQLLKQYKALITKKEQLRKSIEKNSNWEKTKPEFVGYKLYYIPNENYVGTKQGVIYDEICRALPCKFVLDRREKNAELRLDFLTDDIGYDNSKFSTRLIQLTPKLYRLLCYTSYSIVTNEVYESLSADAKKYFSLYAPYITYYDDYTKPYHKLYICLCTSKFNVKSEKVYTQYVKAEPEDLLTELKVTENDIQRFLKSNNLTMSIAEKRLKHYHKDNDGYERKRHNFLNSRRNSKRLGEESLSD